MERGVYKKGEDGGLQGEWVGGWEGGRENI